MQKGIAEAFASSAAVKILLVFFALKSVL